MSKALVIHLLHPANEGDDQYRAICRSITLCWNMKAGCAKTAAPQDVTCKKCLAVMRGRPSSYAIDNHQPTV